MKKKHLIEQAMLKMYGDTPEGHALQIKIWQRERKQQRRKECFFSVLSTTGIVLLVATVLCLIIAAVIVPATYFGWQHTDVTLENISQEDYVYILTGREEPTVLYYSEERNLNNTSIIFTFTTYQTWTPEKVIYEFLAAGNMSDKIIEDQK